MLYPLPPPLPQLLQAHGDAPPSDAGAAGDEVELVPQAAASITVVRPLPLRTNRRRHGRRPTATHSRAATRWRTLSL